MKTLKPRVRIQDTRSAKPLTIAATQRLSTRSGWAWAQIRTRVLMRDNGICQCAECKAQGRLRPAHEVDHILPHWKGGNDDESNLQSINRECHSSKTAREAAERGAG